MPTKYVCNQCNNPEPCVYFDDSGLGPEDCPDPHKVPDWMPTVY